MLPHGDVVVIVQHVISLLIRRTTVETTPRDRGKTVRSARRQVSVPGACFSLLRAHSAGMGAYAADGFRAVVELDNSTSEVDWN